MTLHLLSGKVHGHFFSRVVPCRLAKAIPGSRLLEKVRVRSRPLEDDDAGFAFVDEGARSGST